MIACKARFNFRWHGHLLPRLCLATFFLVASSISAQDYLIPPLYNFRPIPPDYSQRHLSDTVRTLLFRSEYSVQQTGYANSSGNLSNLELVSDFRQLASSGISGLAPNDIDRDLYNAERFTVHLYESFARRWDRLNPIPGLYYTIIIRSAAYPFIFMEALDEYAFTLGTYPFTDDLRFQQTDLNQRQYGFAFRIFY
jgi:hypothetical protein